MKKFFQLIILIAIVICLTGCADVEPNVTNCVTGHEYGFWGGLWHGMISPFAFIGSLIWDDVAVWAVNNNGGWYTFGFILGTGGISLSAKATVKKRK